MKPTFLNPSFRSNNNYVLVKTVKKKHSTEYKLNEESFYLCTCTGKASLQTKTKKAM